MTYFSTGEVSKQLDISVRTLRYYDEIGLLKPALKMDNGKRYYNEQDMLILEKITILKSTSLSLDDIKNVLDQVSISNILSVHKDVLEKKQQHIHESILHTNSLLNILKLEDALNWEQLLPLIAKQKDHSIVEERKRMISHLFNEEEQEILSTNLPKIEDNNKEISQWINIIKRIELCLSKKITPHSEEAQLIVADILLLTEDTFGGDKNLEAKFWEVRKSEELSSSFNLYPIREEVIIFIEEAFNIYELLKK